MNTVSEALEKVITQIFQNWTALQLIIEHLATGSKNKITSEFMDYIINYIQYDESVDVDDLRDELDDYLDSNFDTLCEDGSTKDVAELLSKFHDIILHGSLEEFELEFNKINVHGKPASKESSIAMPPSTFSINESVLNTTEISHNSNGENNAMDTEDSDWIQVKAKNKKRR